MLTTTVTMAYVAILHCLYWFKIIASFNSHLYLAPLLGWQHWKFSKISGVRKISELSNGVVCVILLLA